MVKHSAMFHAFSRCRVTKETPLVSLVVTSMGRYDRARRKAPVKGWSANLSYRTYRSLVAKGVPLQ